MEPMIRQAGAIPWRLRNNRIEILLITNARGSRWQVPKGMVEPFETPRECAAKEAYEEAGIRGTLHEEPAGHWVYAKRGFLHGVDVFPLRVEEEADVYPESFLREREWVLLEDAVPRIEDKNLRPIVSDLPRFLASERLIPAGAAGPQSKAK